MSFLRCTNFRLYFFICSVTPCLNQVFRRCFSMENLRAYAEDEAPASSVQPPVTKGPNTSEGLSTSSSTSASVPSTRTLSGPVQEVSTPLQSSSVVSRDKTVSLKDIPPPPPPDEPYELFLARVACQTLDPAGGTPRPAAAEPVQPPLPLTTVGLRLHTPFPRFEDTSGASIPLVQGPRIRMPLPASCYVPPPQPWTWSGRGPDVPPLQVRSQAPLLSSMGPVRFPGPSTLAGGPPTEGPLPHLLPPTSSSVSKNAASPSPRAFADFFRGPRPLLSRRRPQPAWLLRLSSWICRLMRTFIQDLLQPWSRTGKRKFSRTCDCTGSSCKVTLHLSQLWAPLFPRETWAPTHCGSWAPLATERRHGLSISPVQNEQAASLADAAIHARDHLVTVLDEGTVVPGRLRTPLPAVAGLPLPVAHA